MSEDNKDVESSFARRFRDALQDPLLKSIEDSSSDSDEQSDAALWLAICLGECRLTDTNLGDEDGALPLEIAKVACSRMIETLDGAIEEQDSFVHQFEQASCQMEFEALATDPLHTRMDAWAVYVAVDESIFSESILDSSELENLFDRLGSKIEEFDRVLQNDKELLSIAAETNFLKNWRTLLAGEFKDCFPWFLDGSLEEIAFAEFRPDTSLWRLLDRKEVAQVNLVDRSLKKGHEMPKAFAALAAQGQESFPLGKTNWVWTPNPDGTGHRASLNIPKQLEPGGKTTVRIMFPEESANVLPGSLVALGAMRGVITKRETKLTPGVSIVECVFEWEKLEITQSHLSGTLELRIDGKLWYPQVNQ